MKGKLLRLTFRLPPSASPLSVRLAARVVTGADGGRVGVVRVLAVVAAKAPVARDHAGAGLVRALLLVGVHRVCHLQRPSFSVSRVERGPGCRSVRFDASRACCGAEAVCTTSF